MNCFATKFALHVLGLHTEDVSWMQIDYCAKKITVAYKVRHNTDIEMLCRKNWLRDNIVCSLELLDDEDKLVKLYDFKGAIVLQHVCPKTASNSDAPLEEVLVIGFSSISDLTFPKNHRQGCEYEQ